VIRVTCAIPERIRGGLRRCAIQMDVYFTSLYWSMQAGDAWLAESYICDVILSAERPCDNVSA